MKKTCLFMISLLSLIFIFGCAPKEGSNLDSFAKCITEKGFKEYGSITCSACAATKKSFGSSHQYINYVECNPNAPNSQAELCVEKKIEKTPDWILEKNGEVIKRSNGYLRLKDLDEFTGCSLPTPYKISKML